MKLRKFALTALLLAFVTPAFSQTDTTPAATPAALAAPAVAPSANDTARFLAGLPPAADSPLTVLSTDVAWQDHAKFFDVAWLDLDKKQLSKVRAWDTAYIPAASSSNTPVFYMFSGPDYLYVDAFYPNASTYVLCGIEPLGLLPDVTKIKPGSLRAELQNLQTSLNSVLSFSFFITKDMKNDLQNHELNGTLPIIYIFLARSNKTIHEAGYVGIDADGKVQALDKPLTGHSTLIPGVKITFTQPNSDTLQTLYYFSTDISDDGIKHTPGFLKFCQSLAPGNSFVKSASYLMHDNYFSTIRSFLLKNSLTLVQDDSGIPISFFTPDQWAVRYFGSYPGPIDLFKKDFQSQLSAAYKDSHPIPLDFGIGYRHYASQSTLILATRKSADAPGPAPVPAASPAAPEATPTASATPTPSVLTPLSPTVPAK